MTIAIAMQPRTLLYSHAGAPLPRQSRFVYVSLFAHIAYSGNPRKIFVGAKLAHGIEFVAAITDAQQQAAMGH